MEVESALVDHPMVAEAAVVGKAHELKGQALAAFVILKEGHPATAQLKDDLKDHVAKKIGAIAKPDDIFFVADVPKTRSGKIMRRLLKDVAEGRALGDTTTLADPNVVARLEGSVRERGRMKETAHVGRRMLLVRRSRFPRAARRGARRVRLHRRHCQEPDLRAGLLRALGPRRGDCDHFRPGSNQLPTTAGGLLRLPRSDDLEPPGRRQAGPSTAPPSSRTRNPARPQPWPSSRN